LGSGTRKIKMRLTVVMPIPVNHNALCNTLPVWTLDKYNQAIGIIEIPIYCIRANNSLLSRVSAVSSNMNPIVQIQAQQMRNRNARPIAVLRFRIP
jgi:hypothetical protein